MTPPDTPDPMVPGNTHRFAAGFRSGAIAAILGSVIAVAATVLLGINLSVGLVAVVAIAVGYGLGRRDGTTRERDSTRQLMFRLAEELAQYRAFTKLLRDQVDRINATTGEAATAIVAGLSEVDAKVERLLVILDQGHGLEATEMRALLAAIGTQMIEILGQIQFQDITQQQLAFLSRFSRIIDQHTIELAVRLGDRRSMDGVGNFKEMFNKALDDCVMASQRDDHHAANGLNVQETDGPKVELF
jgi:hypothetical protein